jgi:DUF1365 family protein
MNSRLYFSRVMHRRSRDIRHRFVYRVFALYLDIDELPELHRRLRFFSHNRFNLVSVDDRGRRAHWVRSVISRDFSVIGAPACQSPQWIEAG